MPDWEREYATARQAARMAARLCMAVRGEMLNSAEKMEKAGKEPVTIADYGSQALILRAIADAFPNDGVVAEERGEEFTRLATNSQREAVLRYVSDIAGEPAQVEDIRRWLDHGRGLNTQRIWVVDPIDGTKGFLRGDQFAIAIGLLIDGEPVVGALACPLMAADPANSSDRPGAIATAVAGQGARLEALSGGYEHVLRVSPNPDPARARVVESFESGHTDHAFSAAVLSRAGVQGEVVRMDSQAKYVAVADGRAEFYIRHSQGAYREKIWDHAAGVLIVQEAGGRVTDINGRALDFSAGATLAHNQGILASNGPLHEPLLAAIRAEG